MQGLLAARDIPEYNAGIPGYQAMIKKYNSELAGLKEQIVSYNQIVEKRNAIVGEEKELLKAIDTRVPSTRQ